MLGLRYIILVLSSLSVQSTFRGIHAAIIVFDMGDIRSLIPVKDWKADLFRHSPRDNNIPVLLVGNKVCNLNLNICMYKHVTFD